MKHRELTQPKVHAQMIGCVKVNAPTIEFIVKDPSHVFLPHDDPLMVTLQLRSYEVHRILIDTGSLTNILCKCYKLTNILRHI